MEGCGGGVPPGRAARAPAAKLPPRPPSRWPPASPEPRNWGTESPSSRKTVAQLQGARAIRRLGRLHQRSQSWGAPQLRGGTTVGVRSPGRGWESGGNRPPRSQIPRTAGREARAPGGGGRGRVAVWAPRADSASHLGRGAAVQEFGVSWESRGGGEDGSGRRSGNQDPRPMPGCRPLLRSGPGPAQVLQSSAPRGHTLGPQERRARAVPASGRSSRWRQRWAVTARPARPREGLSGPVIVAVRG